MKGLLVLLDCNLIRIEIESEKADQFDRLHSLTFG